MIRQIDSAWRISNLDLVTRGAARGNPHARENQTPFLLPCRRGATDEGAFSGTHRQS